MKLTFGKARSSTREGRHKHPLFQRLERVEGWVDVGVLALIAALAAAFVLALLAPAGDAPWMN